jgi:splicing factor 3A subunit 3
LHELYNEFINSKFGTPMEYSAYVGTFSHVEKMAQNLKTSRYAVCIFCLDQKHVP